MISLQNFFAQTLMLQPDTAVDIVLDNAKGLTKASAVSERRRKYEAQFASRGKSPKVSRWQSELPPMLTISTRSPQTPQRRESEKLPAAPLGSPQQGSPKLPRRRSSCSVEAVDDDDSSSEEEGDTDTTSSHSRSSLSSHSSRSSDYALVPPRRQNSFFGNTVDANQSVAAVDEPPVERLQPRTTHPMDMVLRLDAHQQGSPKKKSCRTKSAPRPPRRMKSMEQPSDNDDDDEASMRLALSESIHSVLNKAKIEDEPAAPQPHQLTSSEKLVLEDAIRGVVGALSSSRRSASQRRSPGNASA